MYTRLQTTTTRVHNMHGSSVNVWDLWDTAQEPMSLDSLHRLSEIYLLYLSMQNESMRMFNYLFNHRF